MSAPAAELTTDRAAEATYGHTDDASSLPTWRVNVMRIGYALMGVGLAFIKWPLYFQNGGVAALPVYEGVVAALLTAMGLLAFLGLRYPLQMLPLLVLETLWKLIWLAAVGVPALMAGEMSEQMSTVFGSVMLVVVILAVTPWDYVWKRFVRAPGVPWR
ncbi:MAG TPA: hypothetical protein VFP30_03700 [Candidatus Limnocylindria bacterium]|nr:hypothetical protein [Candidatus Limnocylindria bacterium]